MKILMICVWMLPCTFFIYGQSSDCVPNNVANENSSLWSEQCYLGEDCEEQGNPCQANDVRMLGAFVGNATGGPVTTCELGEPVPFYLWGTFYNNTNTMRYAVRTTTELYINGDLNTVINQCSFDEIAPGTSEVVLLGELSYTCGNLMQLYNTWVGWRTSEGQCSDPTGENYASECGEYPPAKCSKEIAPLQFLVPNFSYLCNGSGQTTTTICFSNLTTGGTGPLTYVCNYGDGHTSNNPNACHTYNSTSGTYTVTFTVTDAEGVSAGATTTINLGLVECCQLAYSCPPSNGGLFECAEDVPPIHIDDVTVTDYCGDLNITTDVSSTGDGCPGDTMYITYTYEINDDFSSATCTRVFKVVDSVPPQLTCPPNITVSCASMVPPNNLNSIFAGDNCGEVTITLLPDITTNKTCTNRYILTRSALATDACGNTTSHYMQITVNDQTPPIIMCPPSLTLSCANEIPTPNVTGIVATDACGGGVTVTVLADVTINQTCVNSYTLVRTYRATDVCGNSSTCQQTFTIGDLAPPIITCPPNLTLACAASVPPANIASVNVVDNCDGNAVVTVAPDIITNQTCANKYTITRIYTATDECGNTASCAQTIVVNDNIAPSITCLADLTVSCADDVPGPNINAIVISDNCAGAVAVSVAADVISNFECTNQYVITRVYTAVDICGNTATCAQTITVNDNAPPSIACPANLTLSCSEDVPAANISLIGTTDNCDGAVTVSVAADVISNLTCVNSYTISRVYTAVDVCGNAASCTQTIVVDDNIPPTITCLADMTVSCAGQVPEATTADVVVEDNCEGAVSITILPDVMSNFTCLNSFTVTRVFVATDLCGNTASCAQIIVVDDNTGPSILCPANVTVSCASAIPAPNIASVSASDNCGGASVVVTVAADITTNFTCANSFTITRRYTATDACGNTTTCDQIITVDDNTPPAISCPAPVTVSCASAIPAANISAVVTSDNCGGAVAVTVAADVTANFICTNRQTIVRTYIATDLCGNTATCTQMITVFDGTPPAITCPVNLTVSCASAIPAANVNAIVTSDNCGGGVTVTVAADVTTNFVCPNRFTISRTYTAADVCGNTAACTQTITVFDNTPPSITCPANVTVSCASAVPAASIGAVATSDNCGGAVALTILADVTVSQSCANNFTLQRTYLATDLCGNTATCSQTITVDDNIAPAITCLADVTVSCASAVPAADISAIIATDNCGGTVSVTVAADIITDPVCVNGFEITRIYTATDVCGNTATCVQTITVDDNTGPAMTCPPNVTVSCASAIPVPNTGAITTTDNCGGNVVVTVAPDVTVNATCANRFTIQRTYTAVDVCGNSSTCMQTITVFDNTPPSITCPVNVTVSCASQVPLPSISAVTASDLCGGGVTLSVAADVTVGFTCANSYTVVRTYVATDVCGNSATCTQTIVVDDNTAPTITCLADVTVTCASAIPAVNIAGIVTTDNCGGNVTVTAAADVTTNFTCANSFTILRTYIAADACGNTTACTQSITVDDNTAPTITCPANITVSCASGVPTATTAGVTASDNCGGGAVTISVMADITTNLTCVNSYVLLRTYLATDACGNTATCTQTITVDDNTAPGITCPANVTVSCASAVPAANVGAVITSDNCGGTVTVSVAADVITNQACANSYTITRVYTAVDACGNSATCAQIITVDDNTGPTLTCPANVTVSCASGVPAANVGAVIATDNCGGVVSVTVAADVTTNFICANRYTILRTYTGIDVCGNTSSCVQTITVNDVTPPSITCPANVTVACAASIPAPNVSSVVSSDNCGGSVVVMHVGDVTSNFICANRYTVIRTYLATDMCGNTTNCTQTITVNDVTPPGITCPANVTVSCAGEIPAANVSAVITADNCSGAVSVTVAADITTGASCANGFTILRTYIATDICGNTASCQQTITVDDNTPPSITCPANLTVTCASAVPAANPAIVAAFDNCGLASLTVTALADVISNQSCPNQYTITRVYVATDGCGNTASCAQIITVNDSSAPGITCPANITVTCAAEVPAPNTGSVTTSDNCGGTVTVTTAADVTVNQTCPNSYTLLRTYIAADACGNTATCVQTIIVDDNTAPAITCPPDLTVLCGEEPDPDISLVSATDNCTGAVTIGFVGDSIIGTPCSYVLIYTYIATDACGNTATCEQTITVLDTSQLPAPIEILLPGDITVLCYGQDPNWQVPELDPHDITVNGGCSPPTITHTQSINASEDCAEDGYIAIYEMIYTATDTCGNSDSDTMTITLIDTIPPVLHGVPEDITVTAGNIPPAPAVWATDECLCACVMLLEESPLNTGCIDGKIITRTWSAMDDCGNKATAVQRITVIDTDGPNMALELENGMQIRDGDTLTYQCSAGGIPQFILDIDDHSMTWSDPSGPVTMLFHHDEDRPDNCEFFGYVEQHNFSWEAIDDCGNSQNLSFTVQLTDNVPPVLTGVPEIACINDADLANIEAVDNCTDASVRFWDVPIPNPCGDGTAFRRTYEAFDQCGNIVRDTAILVPNDSISPQMSFAHPDLAGFENGDTMTVQCHFATGQYSPYGPQDVRVIDGCGQGMDVRYTERVLSLENCVNGQRVATIEMTWTALDQCDNRASMSLVASVIDNTPPAFVDFDKEINVGCHEEIPLAVLADDCGTVTISNQDIQLPGPCPYIYDIQRLITATDQCGNVATIDQLIHVGDDNGPDINGVDPEVCDDLNMPVVTAWDECARVNVTVQMVQDTLEDTCADGMVITRTWWAVDACGDTTSITQHIIMGDTVAPEILIPSNSIILDYMDLHEIPLILTSQTEIMNALNALNANSVSAFDNCDLELDPDFTAIITPSHNVAIDGFTEIRFYSWEVTDACGNTDSVSITVHVLDDIPPTTELPGDITVICAPLPPPTNMLPDGGEVVTVQYTETITEGEGHGEFIVTRVWIVTDMSGNQTITTQIITWIPESLLACDIIIPEQVECNSHGVIITSNVTGGYAPYSYYWVIEGDECFIQGPANTPEITIYVGWSDVKIILYVTDSAGCVTVCESIISCEGSIIPLNAQPDQLSPEFTMEGNESQITLWPNPTEGNMEMRFESSDKEEIRITLIDFVGQKVFEEKFSTLKGINLHQLNLNHLPDGAYFMNIESPTINESRKVMIVRRT